MYVIKAEQSFDSAHFLSGYKGKCQHIHGHRWTVQVEVKANNLVKTGQLRGMVEDFTTLKKDIKELVNKFDHALIIEKGTMRKETLNCLLDDGFNIVTVGFRTTAENFSKYFYDEMKERGHSVSRVTVYETPTNSAVYEGE